MIYENDKMKVLTNEVRLSYVNLLKPRAPKPGAEEKYSATILIPKTDFATKADIDMAIQAAAAEGLSRCWNNARPPQMRIPIYDGDGVRPSGEAFGEECRGHWVITGSSKNKPGIIDRFKNDILDPTQIYSGMYGRVVIRFFAYSNSGNKGIGCGLQNVMKTRDGDALGGHASAESDFAGVIEQSEPPAYIPPYGGIPAYSPPPAYTINPVVPGPLRVDPITGLPF